MGQNCLASASESSMLLATMSFLSAFNFSFKISMLVSEAAPEVASEAAPGACCAIAGTAHQIRPARNNAMSFFMIIILSAKGKSGLLFLCERGNGAAQLCRRGIAHGLLYQNVRGPDVLPVIR